MKVFFGDSLEDMIKELRAQAVKTVRLHVFGEVAGQALVTRAHVTTLWNNQVYESVIEERSSLGDVPADAATLS